MKTLRKHAANLLLIAMTVGSLTYLVGSNYVNHQREAAAARPAIEYQVVSGCVDAVVHGASTSGSQQWIRVTHPCTGERVRIYGVCNGTTVYGAPASALNAHSTINCSGRWYDSDHDSDGGGYVWWQYGVPGPPWYALGGGIV